MGKGKTIPLSDKTHRLLAIYAKKKGKFISHIGEEILRDFLETQHELIESEGEMTIEGEEEKPETIVSILKGDQ